MTEHVHHTHSDESTSAATILISVVIVLIIALAFYFGVIRGNIGAGNGGANVELNAPAVGDGAGSAIGGDGQSN